MIKSINHYLSDAGKRMKRSAIREILKHLRKPGMISFAGGLPAPESFPVDDIREVVMEIIEHDGPDGLQYGTTEGDPKLRKMLVERHNRQGLNIGIDNLIIVTGSQQAIDLIAKVFLNPDDYVICGLPSYLGGLNAFSVYGAKLKGIPLDDQGIMVDQMEDTILTLRELGRKVKLVYLIPDFQNPAGITLPNIRREKIIQLAKKYDFLIIEDSPYREVRFEGEPQKLMQELDSSGRVITLCSFSKILAPGFRVGWVIGHPAILDKIVMAKQTADICTSTFVQKIIARYMEKGLLEQNLEKTINLYRERRTFMLKCFEKYMPDGVKWTEPQGGLFLFVTLPSRIDANNIFNRAIERNVAFVTGSTFFCNDQGRNTMRINFSYSNLNEIETGVQRLAEVITEEFASK